MTDQEAYDELSLYTLQKGDPEFIHQYIVDAYAAQHPLDNLKPIRVYFALAGLYLHLEKRFSGRQVQLAHIEMAKKRRSWPVYTAPDDLGKITVFDVLEEPEGPERDKAIIEWSRSVWDAWRDEHPAIALAVSSDLGIK